MPRVYKWEKYELNDIQELIQVNKIRNFTELRTKYSGLLYRIEKLNIKDKLIYYTEKTIPINNVLEAKKFIKDNNIDSLKFLYKNFSIDIFKQIKPFKKELDFKINIKSTWSDLDNLNDIQNFIITEEINNAKELKELYPGLETKLKKLKLLNQVQYSNSLKRSWSSLTIEKVQELIDLRKIRSKNELRLLDQGLFSSVRNNGWLDSLKFHPKEIINTIEGMQNFIFSNQIYSSLDFKIRFKTEYHRCLNKKWISQLNYFPLNSKVKTTWEDRLILFLQTFGYITESEIVSYSNYSKIDIFIPDLNIAIEIQGPYHFPVMGKLEQYLFQRKSDIKKNRWCREQGITLLYFSYDKSLVEKYGYPWYIYTSEKELLAEIERIKSL